MKNYRIKYSRRHFHRSCHVIREAPTAALQGPRRAARATRYVMVIIPCKRPCCLVTRKRRIPRDARWSFWSKRQTSRRSWISPRAPRRISTTRLCEEKHARYANIFHYVKLLDTLDEVNIDYHNGDAAAGVQFDHSLSQASNRIFLRFGY